MTGAAFVAGAACGSCSVQIKTIRLFLVSSAEVLQPALVCTVCSTAKLVGLLSLMMVSVPLRCELHASIVAGLNPPPSVPPSRGSVASTLPSPAFTTTQTLGFAHMANRRWFFTSRPRPPGSPALSPRSYLVMSFMALTSTTAIFFSFSTSAYNFPWPSLWACSIAPPTSIVPTTDPSFGSITVMRGGVNGHAVAANIGDGTDVFVAVQIEHEGVSAARHINAPGVVVGIDIINAAGAHELGGGEHLVRGVGLGEDVAGQQAEARHGQNA